MARPPDAAKPVDTERISGRVLDPEFHRQAALGRLLPGSPDRFFHEVDAGDPASVGGEEDGPYCKQR